MAEYFPGPSDLISDPEKNRLALAIRRLLDRARWWFDRKLYPCEVPKLPPRLRAAIRTAWHHHGRPAFPDLLLKLPGALALYAQIESDLKARRAKALGLFITLSQRLGLAVVGRRGMHSKGNFMSGTHEPIDLSLFANSGRIITPNNWTTIPDHLSTHGEVDYDFGDLKISREDLDKLLTHAEAHRPHVKPQEEPIAAPADGGTSQQGTPAVTAPESPPAPTAALAPERPAEPAEFTAPPRRWISLQATLARPARLLAGAGETHDHPPDAAVREELWRALVAGKIRHQLIVGGAYLPPLIGLARDQDGRLLLVGELWDFVDRARGVLEHPSGVPRLIEICQEDALAHFLAWLQQKQSPAPQPEAVTADQPSPAPPPDSAMSPAPQEAPSGQSETSAAQAEEPIAPANPTLQPKQEPKSLRKVLTDALVSLHQEKRIDISTHVQTVLKLGEIADERAGRKPGSTSKSTVERALKGARTRVAGGGESVKLHHLPSDGPSDGT
jgi:hypothetical protein